MYLLKKTNKYSKSFYYAVQFDSEVKNKLKVFWKYMKVKLSTDFEQYKRFNGLDTYV